MVISIIFYVGILDRKLWHSTYK